MRSSDMICLLIIILSVAALPEAGIASERDVRGVVTAAHAFSRDGDTGHHGAREVSGHGRTERAAAAVAGATRLAQAAAPGREQLVGHWRSTRIVFDSPRDEHLVLRSNGLVERWTVTASGRSATVRGRWGTQANTLNLDWEDGNQWSRPFTFYEGNLVFPNVQNQRRFWERID
jgi:hypothetical protein